MTGTTVHVKFTLTYQFKFLFKSLCVYTNHPNPVAMFLNLDNITQKHEVTLQLDIYEGVRVISRFQVYLLIRNFLLFHVSKGIRTKPTEL